MTSVPLGTSDWQRSVAQEAEILLRNRYFEEDPTNQNEVTALLTRPSLRKWLEVGDGPIRAGGIYSEPGAFEDSLFVVSESTLFRVDQDETITSIGAMSFPSDTSRVSMAATDENLFICGGGALYVYTDNARSQGTLTSTGAIANGDVVEIGGIYYEWTSGDVDTGTPAGTVGDPWLVALGGSAAESLSNLAAAIELTGTEGLTYSTGTVEHEEVYVHLVTSTTLAVRALFPGVAGDSITTTETGANLAWGGATLDGGGDTTFSQVPTPDDVGIISVGHIASYIICVVAEGFEMNGRFYWIEPFHIDIDPLNFATAERAPDPCHAVRVVGDVFWLIGSKTTEVWGPTGDFIAPFQRILGRLFDRGIWEGTDLQIKDEVVVIDTDGVVYRIGSSPRRISNNSIEQRIREAMIEDIQNS